MSFLPDKHRFFEGWARFAIARPWLLVIVGVLSAVLAGWFAYSSLTFRSDRSDLIDPNLPWQKRYASMKQNYPRWDDFIVVVDRASASDENAAWEFLDALAHRVDADDHFDAATPGFDRAELPAWLLLTEPAARVRSTAESLSRTAPVLRSESLPDLLSLVALGATTGALDDTARHELAALLTRADQIANGAPSTSLLGIDGLSGIQRITSNDKPENNPAADGSLAIMPVSHGASARGAANSRAAGVNAQHEAIVALRAHINEVRASDQRFASIEAGVTGVPVFESDETAQSMTDSTRASALSFALVTLMTVLVYRGIIAPGLALVSLVIGIAWSFAWAAIIVGHLQVLSVVFTVVLIGLGFDAAIHLIARLELVHPDHGHMGEAIRKTYGAVGPGIATATATTIAAFAATALTRFAGVAEMGKIAAGGVLLCTVAVMTITPAMLMILPKPEKRIRARAGGESRPFAGRFGLWLDRHPRTIMLVSFVVLTGASALAIRVRYDPDLMKLVPPTAESVVWQQRLARADAGSVWHAKVIVPDLDAARTIAPQLASLPTVGSLDAGARFAISEHDLAERLEIVHALPAPPSGAAEPGEVARDEPARLRSACQSIAQRFAASDAELARAAAALATSEEDGSRRVCAVFRAERATLARYITALRAADGIHPDQLPEDMRSQFVGIDGSVQIIVSPKVEPGMSPLAPDRLEPFVADVLSIAPQATGPAVQIYESSRLIKNAYYDAALYALIAVVVLLFIDLRHGRDVVCSMIPVVSGAILMLATMVIIGEPLNFANTIVMPLLLGIGVDAGVHAVHRWRQQEHDAPAGLAGGSGRAITLTTLTTVIGFACMMIAQHRGIRSLGLVMSLGLIYVWASAILILPAVLRLRTRHRVIRRA